ncbi:hypothetical protein AB0J83_05145 [Actinoplanes sp. NPDC049596]|uniref:hypothetical protein n=1 Tax=unclassified Actinoplanes TaxID=2626549 RepID=UPI00342AFD5A
MSIVGIELRRSAAVGAALLAFAVGTVALYADTGRWAGGWIPMALTLREYTLLLWPLALAAGAWQGRREHRAKVGELFVTTPRSRAGRMRPVLIAMAATIVLAHLLVNVAAGVWIAGTAHYFPLAGFTVITVVGTLSLVAAAWLGLGLGRLWPALVTAPALGVAGVLVIFYGAIMKPRWAGAALSPVFGSGGFFRYQTIDSRVSAALAITMTGLAVTGLLLLVAGRPGLRAAAVLPVVVAAGLAFTIVPRDEATLLGPSDQRARELVCTDDAPKVCVTRIDQNVLPALTPLARQGLAALAKVPGGPTAVHEENYEFGRWDEIPRDNSVVTVSVGIDDHGGLANPDSVVHGVVSGLGVVYQEDCERDGAVERAAAYYLMGRRPVSDVGVVPGVIEESPEITTEAVKLWERLQALPSSEALTRVAAVRQALVDCKSPVGLL